MQTSCLESEVKPAIWQ